MYQSFTKVLSVCSASSCHPTLLFYSSKLMVNHPGQKKKKRAESVNFRDPFWCLGMDSSCSLTDRFSNNCLYTVSGLEKGKNPHTVTLILHKQKSAPEYSFNYHFLPIYSILHKYNFWGSVHKLIILLRAFLLNFSK